MSEWSNPKFFQTISFHFMIGVNTFIFWYKLNQSSGLFFIHPNGLQSTANILQLLCTFLVYLFDNLYLSNLFKRLILRIYLIFFQYFLLLPWGTVRIPTWYQGSSEYSLDTNGPPESPVQLSLSEIWIVSVSFFYKRQGLINYPVK